LRGVGVGMAVTARGEALDWADLTAQLDERGFAVTAPLLTDTETAELADLFDGGRSRPPPDMPRPPFGAGPNPPLAPPAPGPARPPALLPGGPFRPAIDMARHRFGDGRYRYFEHPLPDT